MRANPLRAARVHSSNITRSSKTCTRALLLLAATLLVSVPPNGAVIHLMTLLFQRFKTLSTMTTTPSLLYATVDRRNISVHDVHPVDAAVMRRKQAATLTSAVFATSVEDQMVIDGHLVGPCPSATCAATTGTALKGVNTVSV
jgi:hypothetical protein